MGNCFSSPSVSQPHRRPTAPDTNVRSQLERTTLPTNVVEIAPESPRAVIARQQRADALRDSMQRASQERRRDERASAIEQRNKITSAPAKRDELAGAAEKREQQARLDRQKELYAAFGNCVPESTTECIKENLSKIETALAKLIGNQGKPVDLWATVRTAFVFGNQEKIAAAFALHHLKLLDLNAPGPDGDTVVHAMLIEQPNIKTEGSLTIAERLKLFVNEKVAINCINAAGQKPMEVVLSLKGEQLSETVSTLNDVGISEYQRNRVGETMLHVAARSGNTEAVSLMLDLRLNITAVSHDRSSVLSIAAHEGHTAVVALLLEKGANADDSKALSGAIEAGNAAITDLLLKNGASVDKKQGNKTPLERAVANDDADIAEVLLNRGANMYQTDSRMRNWLHRALKSGKVNVAQVLAAKTNNTEVVDNCGNTALHLAACAGYSEIVSTLLDNRANVDALTFFTGHNKTVELYSALQIAVNNDHINVVKT